jgi:hypothetical protein
MGMRFQSDKDRVDSLSHLHLVFSVLDPQFGVRVELLERTVPQLYLSYITIHV